MRFRDTKSTTAVTRVKTLTEIIVDICDDKKRQIWNKKDRKNSYLLVNSKVHLLAI